MRPNTCEHCITVAVKCRPLLQHEKCDPSLRHCISVDKVNQKQISVLNSDVSQCDGAGTIVSSARAERDASSSVTGRKIFSFDQVFTHDTTHAHVYNRLVQPLIHRVKQGFDATLFAYGQVGSGKTYNMCGMTPFVGRELLSHVQRNATSNRPMPRIQSPGRRTSVRCNRQQSRKISAAQKKCRGLQLRAAYFELYNETIVDLLVHHKKTSPFKQQSTSQTKRMVLGSCVGRNNKPLEKLPTMCGSRSQNTKLRIREHPVSGIFVENLITKCISNEKDLKRLVSSGNKRRSTANHLMNEHSSRSHAVLMLLVVDNSLAPVPLAENKSVRNGTFMQDLVRDRKILSQFNLVDLAGSERASRTGTTGSRLREGAAINKSLSCLRNVVKAVATTHQHSNNTSINHIPFRDSALTRILQPSLLGNTHTAMLATVSPSLEDVDETLCTLEYAQCVATIKHHVRPQQNKLGLERVPDETCCSRREVPSQRQQEQHKPVVNSHIGDENNLTLIESLRRQVAQLESRLNDQCAETKQEQIHANNLHRELMEEKARASRFEMELQSIREKASRQNLKIHALKQKVRSREYYAREMENAVRDATSVILHDASVVTHITKTHSEMPL